METTYRIILEFDSKETATDVLLELKQNVVIRHCGTIRTETVTEETEG